MLQVFDLLPVLSAAENVELPLLLLGTDGGQARTRALEMVGLDGRAGHRPDRLSGGAQQRVAVARALVHPAVVWADEPTGNLDSDSTEAVMALITRFNGAGQTTVMVTHDPHLAAAAHRTVRMRDRRIEEEGTATGTTLADGARVKSG